MPESDINVVITRLGILSDDVGELKETLRQIATAVTRLALVEERQSQTNEALGRAFKSIDKIDGNRGMATRLGNLMARLGLSKGRRSTGKREWIYLRPAPAKEVPNTMGEADEPVPF